ncbi:MAG: 2,4'-dihydroxyacetophenone dioxygenase family protein [Deltaproteobacteria bacterium]
MATTDEQPDMAELLQAGATLPTHGLTEAMHIGKDDLPFVDLGDGSTLQLLQVDLNQGLWVINTRFSPGYKVQKHYHTGPVFAVTHSGSWYYKEYPDDVNRAGSYLYEPAHSVHTLMVSEDNEGDTEVWFAINGANINMDEEGRVVGVVDAQGVLGVYRALCEAQGVSHEKVIVIGEPK